MPETRKTIETDVAYRFFTVKREAIDVTARTAELAFSSEDPYERYFGAEILDHGPQSIRLGRLVDSGPLLLDHDPRKHIGVIEEVSIGADRKGRARVRFGRGALAEEVFQDVQDGIRQHVSVGYIVHRMTLETEEDDHATYRVDDWEPLEISIVPIPADTTVGIGRSAESTTVQTVVKVQTTVIENRAAPKAPPVEPTPEPIIEVISMSDPIPSGVDKRAEQIALIGATYSKYVNSRDVADAIQTGKTVDQFQDLVMQKMQTTHSDVSALKVGLSKKESERYSLVRALNAAMTGNWAAAGFEREASEACGKLFGRSAEGFYIPYDAFDTMKRDFTAGTAGEAGNLVATELRGDLFTDALRNSLVFGRMGCTMLTGLTSNIDMPRKSVAGAVGYLAEITTATETQPTTVKVTLSPRRISAFVQVSKQAIIQGSMSIEDMIRQDLLDGVAVQFENSAINGTGAGVNPRGIRSVAGIGSVVGGTNGLAFNWSHVTGLEAACANANAEPDLYAGYLVNTRVRNTAKNTQKATNLPFLWDNGAQPLNGYRAFVTNNVPSNLTKGSSVGICSSAIFGSDWRMWVMAVFGGFDVTVDPYSQKNSGMVEIAVNAYVDHNSRQPAAFAVMDDALTP
jgi:HK97 family phage major capsid protein/HK97 family phage prohead protease